MPDESIRLVHASGECEIDLARRELRVFGAPVPVGGRAFEIIEVLARSAGELVTKNQLMDRVWPGAIVSDNTLQVHAMAVRKALGPYRSLLKTVSGRGYRLLGDWAARRHDAARPPVGLQRTRDVGLSPVTNFPAAVTHLVGRTAAIARVRDLVSAYRVVTLTGPGGIGKTSLALKAARGIVGGFADGGWLVELASLSDPARVPSTLAGVLGLKLGAEETSGEAVARVVGENNLLLLLDNCEHVIDAAARLVETVMRLCPRVTILATSRESLRVDGEYVYRVAPLEVPEADEDEPERLLSRSAVELFVARTSAFSSDSSSRAENLAEIAAICRHLDGIPLAIEFAAARAVVLGVQQVTAGLHDRFELLKAGRRTALPRHQTLRAALDWSYDLLPEAEKRLLRCLAIFSGGFTIAAADFVVNDFDGDPSAVTDGIANLVAKSLVTLDSAETETRWYLLETTRAYALEKLAERDEARQTARRHTEFCSELFSSLATDGQPRAADDDLTRYRREIDNLRTALTWAFSADGDDALGVDLAAAAADFWSAVSLVAEACEWAGKALTRIGDAVGTRREMILRRYHLGLTLMFTKGMHDDARAALTRGADARPGTDRCRLSATGDDQFLWLFACRTAALHDALARAREYDEIARLDDPQSRAAADWLVGIPLIYLGMHIEASERLQRVVDDYPIASLSRHIIVFGADLRTVVFSNLAVSLLSRGLLDAASQAVMCAIEAARGTNAPASLCIALAAAAGFVFLSLVELDMAERYNDELIDHADKHTLRPFHATGLCVRGSLAVKRGDPNAGIDLLRGGLAEMRETTLLLHYHTWVTMASEACRGPGRGWPDR